MVDVVDLPALPPAAARPNVAGGVKIAEYAALEKNEKILGLIDLDREFVVGTAQGVVKRVSVAGRPNKNEWETITLKGKDTVVGVAQPEDIDDSLAVFVTSNAQLLAFDASGLRAQGWNASGVAGIKVAADARVVFFGMTPKAAKTDEDGAADAELGSFAVVTIASGENFYGAPSSSIKVSEFSEFPTKGRATSGVRAPSSSRERPSCLWHGSGIRRRPQPRPAVLARCPRNCRGVTARDPRWSRRSTSSALCPASVGPRASTIPQRTRRRTPRPVARRRPICRIDRRGELPVLPHAPGRRSPQARSPGAEACGQGTAWSAGIGDEFRWARTRSR